MEQELAIKLQQDGITELDITSGIILSFREYKRREDEKLSQKPLQGRPSFRLGTPAGSCFHLRLPDPLPVG